MCANGVFFFQEAPGYSSRVPELITETRGHACAHSWLNVSGPWGESGRL